MKWTEYSITNRIKNVLDAYSKLDTTDSTIRARRMMDVRAYAGDLFRRGYNTDEVHYYVNQVTSPYGFGVNRVAIHQEKEKALQGGYFQ